MPEAIGEYEKLVAERQKDGTYKWLDAIEVVKPKVEGHAHPAGVAAAGPDELWVATTRGNSVQRVNLAAGQVEGGVPVAGQRGGQRGLVAGQAGVGGQRLGVGGVQVGPLAGQHVLIHRVPGQRVPELVAVSRRVDHQQVVLHGLPQRGEEFGPGDPGDLGEQPVRRRPARH